MIKVLALLRRRPDMTREECHRYWREVHAGIARQMPGVRGYVLNLASSGPGGDEPPFDGVAELWFDDFAAYQAAFAAEAGRQTMQDVPNFTDGQLQVILAQEHVVVPKAEGQA